MTIQEHLLVIVGEEGSEIAHRAAKALRFSLDETQPGQKLSNADRIMEEYYDLVAVIEKCQRMNILPEWDERQIIFHKEAKNLKVEEFLVHSKENGTLQ